MSDVVIEARGVEKTFRVPLHKVDSLKERATHPLSRPPFRDLRALDGISFDVHEGEFFGIVGRNGSGKSTLLKILASIYRTDAGRVRMAGRLAPFIELGVGFNPELSARENVVLNGVLMGLTRREASSKLGAVLEFAELEEFVDLKLKNYSSGMAVRLAFAVMVQADADIMLIDEVLAVGDAAFAQKCMDVFHDRQKAGRTIVLVTHDMAMVQRLCDRAMLLHDSRLEYIGDAEEAAVRYFRLNFNTGEDASGGGGAIPDLNARVLRSWLEDAGGETITNVEQGHEIRVNLVVEPRRELLGPRFGLTFTNAEGVAAFSFSESLGDRVKAGERLRITATCDNPLLPGRYTVDAFIFRRDEGGGANQMIRLFDFVVFGTGTGPGVVSVNSSVDVVAEP